MATLHYEENGLKITTSENEEIIVKDTEQGLTIEVKEKIK